MRKKLLVTELALFITMSMMFTGCGHKSSTENEGADSTGSETVVTDESGDAGISADDENGDKFDEDTDGKTADGDAPAGDGTGDGEGAVEDAVEDAEPETPPHEHSYTSEITQEPTCTVAGVMTYTCECGDSYTEEIEATGHTWTTNYKTVHHDAVTHTEQVDNGHYESVQAEDHIYHCLYCDREFHSKDYGSEEAAADAFNAHVNNGECPGVLVDHMYEAYSVNQWIPNVQTVTVVDSEAYDEQVASGQICTVCGATK